MAFRQSFVFIALLSLAACSTQMPQSALPREAAVQNNNTIVMPATYAMATPVASNNPLANSANPCARGMDDALTHLEKLMAAKGAKPYVSAAAY
jgi:hypothetical protein